MGINYFIKDSPTNPSKSRQLGGAKCYENHVIPLLVQIFVRYWGFPTQSISILGIVYDDKGIDPDCNGAILN